MSPAPDHLVRRSSLDLLEEALHLVRKSPLSVLALYYIGALPLMLAVLYFFADMSRSPFAASQINHEALLVAVLLVWMKTWQGLYMRRLMLQAQAQPPEGLSLRQTLRLAVAQAAVQPWGLVLLPLSLGAMVPLPWVYAFFQNFCLLGASPAYTTRQAIAAAWRQACLWPSQSAGALALLTVVGAVVWVNVLYGLLLPPQLLKSLLGIETVLSRGFNPMNLTFMALTLVLALLAMGPLVAGFFTLRCFYGNSVRTGEDLQADLKRARDSRLSAAATVVIGLLMMLPLLMGASASPAAAPKAPLAVESTSQPAKGAVSPGELDSSIKKVITRPEYSWRMPRDSGPKAQKGPSWLETQLEALGKKMDQFWNWLFPPRQKKPSTEKTDSSAESGVDFSDIVRVLLVVLLVVAIAAILVLLLRMRFRRQAQAAKAQSTQATPLPDVSSESVSATDLPESGWLAMARDYLQNGQYRLALRAMYLAMLATLAEGNLLTVARFKSNREYFCELSRRAHAMPQTVEAFGQNLRSFEDAWYGMHEVSQGQIDQFLANQERMKKLGGS